MPFDTHSTANSLPLAILKKFILFLKNPSIFLIKTLNFERFDESYSFSHILRQICYNLVNKITLRNVNAHRDHNWQTSVKKTHPFEQMILLPCCIIWRKIVTCDWEPWTRSLVEKGQNTRRQINTVLIRQSCSEILHVHGLKHPFSDVKVMIAKISEQSWRETFPWIFQWVAFLQSRTTKGGWHPPKFILRREKSEICVRLVFSVFATLKKKLKHCSLNQNCFFSTTLCSFKGSIKKEF